MKKGYDLIQKLSAVIVLIGAALQITRWEFSPYIYILGAILFAYTQAMDGYEGKNLIIRRLRRQQILGAALLVFTGVLMIVTHNNEWILCLTIAAILELYTAFRIPNEMEKDK
jgi:drug/metabolite transporter (DMT)-like permease